MTKLSKETEITVCGCKIVLQMDSADTYTSFGSKYNFLQAEKVLESLMKNYVQFTEPEQPKLTELEKAAKDYGDNFYCEEVNPEEAFIKGANWLAEKLIEHYSQEESATECTYLMSVIKDLTKISEGK